MRIRADRFVELAALALSGMLLACGLSWSQGYHTTYALGVPATAGDIAEVAIAIPADGAGLPPGKGDAAAGKLVYEKVCAACHGVNMQGVAGIHDMPSGPALRLIGGRGTLASTRPVLTVESYWPYATTLFDYVRRAMPFSEPGSLTDNEVYAVAAYILAEAKIIDRSTVLDSQTLPKVVMPNRDGFIPDPRPEFFK